MLDTVFIESGSPVGQQPDVAYNGQDYLVVWSEGYFGSDYKVRSIRVSPAGAVTDTSIPFGINAFCEYHPAVSFDGNRHLAVWYTYVADQSGVYGRFIGMDGMPQGREVVIRQLPAYSMADCDITFLDSVYLVVWAEPTGLRYEDIWGRLVSHNGSLIGDAVPISEGSGHDFAPRATADSAGFCVTWCTDDVIMARRLSAAGVPAGSSFVVSDPGFTPATAPDVAAIGSSCLWVWEQFINGNDDIYGGCDLPVKVHERVDTTVCPTSLRTHITTDPARVPIAIDDRIIDICGRKANPDRLSQGIYFVERAGRVTMRIIVVR